MKIIKMLGFILIVFMLMFSVAFAVEPLLHVDAIYENESGETYTYSGDLNAFDALNSLGVYESGEKTYSIKQLDVSLLKDYELESGVELPEYIDSFDGNDHTLTYTSTGEINRLLIF